MLRSRASSTAAGARVSGPPTPSLTFQEFIDSKMASHLYSCQGRFTQKGFRSWFSSRYKDEMLSLYADEIFDTAMAHEAARARKRFSKDDASSQLSFDDPSLALPDYLIVSGGPKKDKVHVQLKHAVLKDLAEHLSYLRDELTRRLGRVDRLDKLYLSLLDIARGDVSAKVVDVFRFFSSKLL